MIPEGFRALYQRQKEEVEMVVLEILFGNGDIDDYIGKYFFRGSELLMEFVCNLHTIQTETDWSVKIFLFIGQVHLSSIWAIF